MTGAQDADQRAREWRGFSCPACHTLFRVPGGSTGRRAACPTCGEVALIPGEELIRELASAAPSAPPSAAGSPAASQGEGVSVAVASEATEESGGGERSGEPVRVRKRKRSSKSSGKGHRRRRAVRSRREENVIFDWERELSRGRVAREEGPMVIVWSVVLGLTLVLGILILLVVLGNASERPASPPPEEPAPAERSGGILWDEPEEEIDALAARLAGLDLGDTLRLIEGRVLRFLAAESVEELLPLIRGGEGLRGRLEAFYGDGAPRAERGARVAPQGRVRHRGRFWSVQVDIPTGSRRAIALEQVGDQWLVDWESWVGFCELSWEDFLRDRPTRAALFRVYCAPDHYYNYGFTEREWRSFRLVAPHGGETVYGYVGEVTTGRERLSESSWAQDPGLRAYTLRLRYPPESQSGTQVIIAEVVCAGWVTDDPGPSSETTTAAWPRGRPNPASDS